jgi:hypothetical protein
MKIEARPVEVIAPTEIDANEWGALIAVTFALAGAIVAAVSD